MCSWKCIRERRESVPLGDGPEFREGSPVGGFVVLQEFAPDMFTGVVAGDDGIDDPGGAVDNIERRMKPVFLLFACGDLDGVFIGDPAGVDGIHVDSVGVVIGCRGAGHHVERRLGHVGMRVSGGLELAVELAFDG